MAQDVIDMLDHFGWKDSVHVNGVSMGGMISLELVSTWPERFSSLVLTSTTLQELTVCFSGKQLVHSVD
jgi:pimeloyl-ACP methyl ester carboxylesterase